MLSEETGNQHPILFVDVSCWNGESMVALLEDVGIGGQSGRSAPPGSAEGSEEGGAFANAPIYGLFFDKKDVHYQVSKLRRDLRNKRRFMDQMLPLQGEQAKPCPELLALREKSDHLKLKALCVLGHSGTPTLGIPSEMDLPFMVQPGLKRRLGELRLAYGETAAKRTRASPADATEMPDQIGVQALLGQFQILGRGTLRVESKEVEVIQVGVESAGGSGDGHASSTVDTSAGWSGDGASTPQARYFFYLANPSVNKQVTLPAQTLLTKGTRGTFYNRLSPEHEEILAHLPEKVVLWQWSLSQQSLFEFQVNGVATVCAWTGDV